MSVVPLTRVHQLKLINLSEPRVRKIKFNEDCFKLLRNARLAKALPMSKEERQQNEIRMRQEGLEETRKSKKEFRKIRIHEDNIADGEESGYGHGYTGVIHVAYI